MNFRLSDTRHLSTGGNLTGGLGSCLLFASTVSLPAVLLGHIGLLRLKGQCAISCVLVVAFIFSNYEAFSISMNFLFPDPNDVSCRCRKHRVYLKIRGQLYTWRIWQGQSTRSTQNMFAFQRLSSASGVETILLIPVPVLAPSSNYECPRGAQQEVGDWAVGIALFDPDLPLADPQCQGRISCDNRLSCVWNHELADCYL